MNDSFWPLALLGDRAKGCVEPLIAKARNTAERDAAYRLAVRLDAETAEEVVPDNGFESTTLGSYGTLAGSWLIRAKRLCGDDHAKWNWAIGMAASLDTGLWDLDMEVDDDAE